MIINNIYKTNYQHCCVKKWPNISKVHCVKEAFLLFATETKYYAHSLQ